MADILENPVDLIDDAYEQEIQVEQEMIEVVAYRSYNRLDDKPQINGVELVGNKTSSDLGITAQIESAVNSEAQARAQADNTLQGKIDTEKLARQQADSTLQGNIDAEETARKAADKDIQDVLDGETLARQNADTALGGRIDTEIHDRQVADIALQGQIDAITSKSDVVDVVANYVALQAYDTSSLGNNDVIKVLDDETHEDALTYYRWSTTTQTWTYIGQESPYYSKSQTDTLLLGKQNTIDSSHKLSADLVDDTSTTNKFVTASDITNWNAKQDALTAGTGIDITGGVISTPAIVPEVVAELPTTGEDGKLYLTPKAYAGKNLLDQDTLVAGYLSSYGEDVDIQTMGVMRSGYIKVEPNSKLTLSIQATSSNYTQWFRIIFFDANKVRISDVSATTGDARSYTITTPANTAYLRLCGRNMADATAIQLEYGGVVTQYEPFIEQDPNYKYEKWLWIDGVWERMDELQTIEALARNQIDGNLRDLMNFEVGDISAATGDNFDNYDDAYRGKLLRNDRIYKFNFSLYIPASEVTKTTLYTYTDEGEFIREIFPFTNNTKGWFIPANTSFRIRLDYNTIPDGGRPTITDPKTSSIYQNFSIVPFEDYKANTLAKLQGEGNVIDPSNLKYSLRLAIADINNAGIDYTGGANRRIATYDILHFEHDIVLPKQSNFYFYLWTYADQSGAGASGQGWKYLTDSEYVIPAGTYFRLLFVIDRTSTTPLYDIYDNDIFKAIEIYKKVEQAKGIEYNKNLRSVAHQGYSVIASESYGNCRLSSYVGAKEHGFDYGECDVKFSSDGIPVCSHDATFTDSTTSESVIIADHTWAELQNYNYHHERLASLEQVLSKCKEIGLGLYIDHLSGGWSDAYWNTIFTIVNKYQMQDNVYWLQGIDRSVSNRILSWYSRAKIVLVISASDLTSAITEANAIKTDLNEVSIDFNYTQVTVAQMQSYAAQLKTGVQLEIWTVDNATDYKNYLPYARGITSNKLCYNDVYEDL